MTLFGGVDRVLSDAGVTFKRDDSGLTPPRFYSSVFSVWIAVIVILLACRLAGLGRDRSGFTSAVGLSAVAYLETGRPSR